MDMLSPTPSPQAQTNKLDHWPHKPAVRGQTYGIEDPVHTGQKLVVMSNDTWLDYGTAFEQLRRQVAEAFKASEKLKVSYDIALQELAALREKHENLRRAEKRRRQAAMGLKGSHS